MGFLRDLRRAARSLLATPTLAALAVLTLALGIGANTAIFSLLDAVLLRPLPFPHSQQLVALLETSPQFARMGVAYPDYLDWRDANHAFSGLAALRGSDMILTHLGEPAMVVGQRVSANYFAVLGVSPALGRGFVPAEDHAGAPDVVVVSATFWRQRLGADPHWLGRAIHLDGRLRTIVGVMPSGFPGILNATDAPQFWTPLGAFAEATPGFMNRGNHAGILVLGRLRAGVPIGAARADLAAVAAHLAAAHPATNTGTAVAAQPYLDFLVGDARPALDLLLAAVGLVLLIACANVANLLLARAAAQHRADAIRLSLGATRARLLREHLAVSLCLGGAGGALGLAAAALGLRACRALFPATLPRAVSLSPDGRVLAFALALALLTTLLCGLAPALAAGRGGIAAVLQRAGRAPSGAPHRLRALLVATEMALALLLLLGAGLLAHSLLLLQRQSPGFHPNGVLTFILGLPDTRYPQPSQQLAFFRQLDQRLEALPGVAAAGGAYPLPLAGDRAEPFTIVGRPAPAPGSEPATDIASVRGHYFAALGATLLRGRSFDARDTAAAPQVAIVDDTLAATFWPGSLDASLGRQINLDGVNRTIVGIVGHLQDASLEGPPRLETFIPQEQDAAMAAVLSFALRAAPGLDPLSLRDASLAQVHALDPDQPVTEVETMAQILDLNLAQRRLSLALMGAFALLAMLLALVGIYGVVAFSVSQRVHEFGIRMALGARRGHVLQQVVGEGLRLAAAGVLVGLLAAALLGRLAAAFLYGVNWYDPLALLAAPLLLAVALLACYLPAARATRIDPARALRSE